MGTARHHERAFLRQAWPSSPSLGSPVIFKYMNFVGFETWRPSGALLLVLRYSISCCDLCASRDRLEQESFNFAVFQSCSTFHNALSEFIKKLRLALRSLSYPAHDK